VPYKPKKRPRDLVLVLGDQLDPDSAAFDAFDSASDAVWMAEVLEESALVWSHKARIILFLSAMRHFRDLLLRKGITVHYRQLDDPGNRGTLALELKEAVRRLRPQRLILVTPGEWRVKEDLVKGAKTTHVPLEIRADRHFLNTGEAFSRFATGRKTLRMEFFYRNMRRETGILMDGDKPVGGKWNYDAENRKTFGKSGPGKISPPRSFSPDKTTRDVIKLVEKRFSEHPGRVTHFDWPVTPEQAGAALEDFVQNRLLYFGPYEDAMWSQEPYLFHSRLSSSLNLKLLDPRTVLAASQKAYEEGQAPINSVEGLVRQILGWREYVRGIYWHFMPRYKTLNALKADLPLPPFYWTAETDMNCLRETVGQTLSYGFAHHIQRLMVTGLFALLLGVKPQEVHRWYLAVYVDAVEWVELPNTLGMSQFADGGIMASKPYVATGKYIQRMSDYCHSCRFDPSMSVGEKACPFTTLYWDFLMRHGSLLRKNARMKLQMHNLDKLAKEQARAIRRQAKATQKQVTA
jgi:deoxyribodipyrimidine photolyase-related protein